MKPNTIMSIGAALLALSVASVFALRACKRMDVVQAYFKDEKALTDAALTWIGFGRGEVVGARDIHLNTDLDTNAYLVSMRFSGKLDLARFEGLLKARASNVRKIPCGTPNPQCSLFTPAPKGTIHFELKPKESATEVVHWVLNPETYAAVGSTSLPPPAYLSRIPAPAASPR
jgi:hypothetical protein